jgi:hypothetical protein
MLRPCAAALVAVICLTFLTPFALAQNPPSSDPQALSFANQSIAVLTEGSVISDVTLSGNATWIAGSDNQSGTATLYAKGAGESRIDLNLSGGLQSEIRNDLAAGYPQGESVVTGTATQWATHNCWINASWFFPALSFLSTTSDSTLIFTYVGQESRNGGQVQHLQVYRYLATQKPAAITLIQQVSTADVYLDATSLLPVAVLFNSHPDDDAMTNISIEVDYSNYQPINGIQVPMHIQKFISGGLALDVTAASAIFNAGLSDSLFTIQ